MPDLQPALLDRIETLSKLTGAKWKPAIMLCLIVNGRQRFSDLKRALPRITQRMLAERLRELERDGLLIRSFHAEMPVRVEYELTALGRSLQPVYKALHDWGSANEFGIIRARRLSEKRSRLAEAR